MGNEGHCGLWAPKAAVLWPQWRCSGDPSTPPRLVPLPPDGGRRRPHAVARATLEPGAGPAWMSFPLSRGSGGARYFTALFHLELKLPTLVPKMSPSTRGSGNRNLHPLPAERGPRAWAARTDSQQRPDEALVAAGDADHRGPQDVRDDPEPSHGCRPPGTTQPRLHY